MGHRLRGGAHNIGGRVIADNSQKTALASSLNRFAARKIADFSQISGKALPCSIVAVDGSIVTVSFELAASPFTLPNVTIPVAYPEYIRVPFQIGDKGAAVSADVVLGGINGLGAGVPARALPANLSALYFVPIGNKNWTAPIDPDKLELYGPAGVVLHALGGNVTVTITKDDVTVDINGQQLVITETTMTWDGDLVVKGAITAGSGTGDEVTVQHHTHGGVTAGPDETDEPTAGT